MTFSFRRKPQLGEKSPVPSFWRKPESRHNGFLLHYSAKGRNPALTVFPPNAGLRSANGHEKKKTGFWLSPE
jgi:hypothetical protein